MGIECLVISNILDFTTDYVCLELAKRDIRYFRINREDFKQLKITYHIETNEMVIESSHGLYKICDELKSVYYRAPIYLRDVYVPGIPVEEQLFRTQWVAFIRNLTVYSDAVWVNNPEATFKAENKLLQLRMARAIGFSCPWTLVTNTTEIDLDNRFYAVKSLDTVLLRVGEKEAFVYTNVLNGNEIISSNLSLAPIIVQQYLNPKIDIRATVIGRRVYATQILQNGKGVPGDWRLLKDNVSFIPVSLPKEIEAKCIDIVKMFGLYFGAIDLAEHNGQYFFIELNPTGEWAWLVDASGLDIYAGICDVLEGKLL